MNERTKDAGVGAETVEAQARRLGLTRLYERFPVIYEAAAKRAQIKLEAIPRGVSAATEPSLIFVARHNGTDD